MTHIFYKENNLWYIHLPEFIQAGLGTKNNLLMVDGADTLLDILANGHNRIQLKIDTKPIDNSDAILESICIGIDQTVLDKVGHAPVSYGMYYVDQIRKHKLWLCPVTEYVFSGIYPKNIWIKVLE